LFLVHRDVLFDAAESSQFCFNRETLGVRAFDDALGNLNVLIEWLVRGVNHHGRIKAAVNAVVAGLLIAVVQVDSEDGLGKNIVSDADHRFEHFLMGVGAGTLANLYNEGSLAVHVAAEQAHGLLEVVDVVRANAVLSICSLEQLFGGNDHFFTP
jgi:hypothetical protein